MKLYKHYSRLAFVRLVSKRLQKRILWALSLKPGDLVNGCSGFNHRVAEVKPEIWQTGKGWYISNVDFVMQDGACCSLLHCGVSTPLSRDEIENEHLKFLNYYLTNPKGAAQWYGGLDNPKYKDEIDKLIRTWEILKNGEHICDEYGVKL